MKAVLDGIDFGDEKKARRSLILLSVAKIIFSNIQFVENVINLGVVEIVFSPQRISQIGDFFLWAVFVVFILRSLPKYVSSVEVFSVRRIERKKEFDDIRFRDHWGLSETPQIEDSPEAEARDIEERYRSAMTRVRKRFADLRFYVDVLAVTITDYALPVVLFGFAVAPNALNGLASYVAQ
jgi:hypothetical protein